MIQALMPGERAPEVLQVRPDRHVVTFYELFCGRPLVLWVARRAAGAGDGLAALAARFAGRPTVTLAAVLPGGTDLGGLPAAVVPFPDQGDLTDHLLGSDTTGPAILVFDPLLRLAAIVEPGPDAGARVESALSVLADGSEGPGAPVLMVDRVLDPDLCTRLMALHDRENTVSTMTRIVDGTPQQVEDRGAKSRRDHILQDAGLSAAVVAALQRRLLPEVAKAFRFQPRSYESLKIVSYGAGEGGYFRLHRDNISPDAAHRSFALTLTLNADYRGGELRFPEYGPHRYKPAAGGAIVFSCSHLHELTDVTAGRRYALLTFF